MTERQHNTSRIKTGLELPWWFTRQMHAVNEDFTKRVVSLPEYAQWHSTQIAGIDLRILEYVPGTKPRLTGQLRLDPARSPALLGKNPDLEVLVQRGEIESEMGVFPSGLYLRLPLSDDHGLQDLTVRCTGASAGVHKLVSALLYFAAGQMLVSDTEQRRLNTHNESYWLPGPVEGTEVLPLHGHGSANVMLIRWTETVAFKTRLDPMGEELLVLNGALDDVHGHYPAGTWIRNPEVAWQSWGARKGTVVYYKNGHLAAPT